jgi:O-antigen/teichoic acid export membrane protein
MGARRKGTTLQEIDRGKGSASAADDGGRQFRHTLLYLVPTMIGNLLPIITLPVFMRILTPEDYGVWGVCFAYGAFAAGVANLGLVVGYERNFFEAKSDQEHATLLSSALIFVHAMLLGVGLFTWLGRHQLADFLLGDAAFAPLLVLAYAAVALSSLKQYFLTYFKNRAEPRAFVAYSLDETILSVCSSFVLVVGLGAGVLGLVLGPLIGSSVVSLMLLFRFRRVLTFRIDGRVLASILSISAPLTPRIFLGALGNQFDKYLVASLGTLGLAGIYTIGQKIGQFVFAYMTAIQNVYAPRVYRLMFDGGSGAAATIAAYLLPYAYASAGLALLAILFAEEALIILAPPTFREASMVVTLFALHYALMFFGKQPQLIYARKTALTSLLSILSLVLMIMGTYVGVRLGGAAGAAGGMLAAGAVSGSISLLVSQRYYRIAYDWTAMGAIFGTLFVAAAASVLLQGLEPSLPKTLGKLVFLGIFGWIGHELGIVRQANLRTMWKAVAPRLRA